MPAAQCGEALAPLPKRGQCRDATQRAAGASSSRCGSATGTACGRNASGTHASACHDAGSHACNRSGDHASAAGTPAGRANPDHHCTRTSAETRGETGDGTCRPVSCGARPDAAGHTSRSARDRTRLRWRHPGRVQTSAARQRAGDRMPGRERAGVVASLQAGAQQRPIRPLTLLKRAQRQISPAIYAGSQFSNRSRSAATAIGRSFGIARLSPPVMPSRQTGTLIVCARASTASTCTAGTVTT